ncbi:MAG: glycosyltransferase family 2 protein [Sphingobacteriaceae bacterium]|nr:MAG: glycosyltransferase family 2 protein [Sphingobacteriaceae bacterium]
MNNLVSVIIPCYNCANTIGRAIDSVLRQVYQPIEIILVNNNSTDETPEVLTSYQKLYPDKITVLNQPKPGAPAARNCGLYHAGGKWIQFLDADDELLPAKIEKQMQLAEANQADIVAGECLLKYTSENEATTIVRTTDKDIWRGLITSNLGITSSNLWRRATLLDINGWDEELTSSQEYDLLLRLLENKAKVVTDQLMNTVVHFSGNSVSKSTNVERKKEVLNNRISLRLRIKETLERQQMLTVRLSRIIDIYIYTEIIHYYNYFPDYAGALIRKHKLNVSVVRKLRLKAKNFLKSIRFLLNLF